MARNDTTSSATDPAGQSSIGPFVLWDMSIKRAWMAAGIGALLALTIALLLGFLVQPRTLVNDMSDSRTPNDVVYDPLDYAHGLYPSEKLADGTTYRWTNAQATLTFPFAANLGRNAHVSIRVASGWADGQPDATGTLVVNGKVVANFTADKDFQVVEATIDTKVVPSPYLDPAHIQIDIKSSTSRPTGDTRDLGVAVDWIRVVPERSRTEILLEGLVWALLVGLVLFVGMVRLDIMWGVVFGAGALLTLVGLHLTYLPRGITPTVEVALAGLGWVLVAWLTPKKMPALGLALAAAMIWVVIAGRILGDWQLDDAYISYRYAWNLAHGHGLVYNTTGQPVEGYTNFLWTLVSALAIVVGWNPAAVTLALNIALTMGVLALTWHLAAKLSGGEHLWALPAIGLLAVDGSLLAYGARGSGMEAMPFAFLTLLAITLLWIDKGEQTGRWRVAAGLTLALGVLTRPEGLLVTGVLLIMRMLYDRLEGSSVWRRLGLAVGPFLLVVVPYQVWRIAFYGYPLPNTFYAKTGNSTALIARGLEHTGYFLNERGLVIVLAAISILFALVRWRRDGLRLTLVALLLAYEAYIVWVGGDYFPSWRFFVPLLAPLMLVAMEGARSLAGLLPRHRLAIPAALGLGAALMVAYVNSAVEQLKPDSVHMDLTKLHTSYVNLWGSAGLWLRDNTPPASTTAAKGAGAIAYFSDRYVIDVYGLNDLHIGHLQVDEIGEGKAGHEKKDPPYVLSLKPDYIYGQWANYFDPVAEQLAQQYKTVSEKSPTGPALDWLERK